MCEAIELCSEKQASLLNNSVFNFLNPLAKSPSYFSVLQGEPRSVTISNLIHNGPYKNVIIVFMEEK